MKTVLTVGPRLAIFIGTLLLAGGCSAEEGVNAGEADATGGFCTAALDAAQLQLDGFRKAYPDPARIARSYDKGQAKMVETRDWTSGFVSGSFWYMYEYTHNPGWLKTAQLWTGELESQKNNTGTHDLGFIMFNMGAVIANAVFDATGVRFFELPLTPKRVKAALT